MTKNEYFIVSLLKLLLVLLCDLVNEGRPAAKIRYDLLSQGISILNLTSKTEQGGSAPDLLVPDLNQTLQGHLITFVALRYAFAQLRHQKFATK